MLIQILQNTPPWVWVLLAALIAFGWSQTLAREMTALRIAVLPAVLILLSLVGVATSFPHQAVPVVAWAAGVALALGLGRGLVRVRGARWNAVTRRLQVPGSWLPFVLMMGLFVIKYGVGVSLAMKPALAADAGFDTAVGLAYGAFSGLFLARAAGLWQLARRAPVAAA
jgi:hypothetical protein